jgi:hypothetical protein
MTLPDQAFFELVRSVLGAVKTPFNKQTILEDLSVFISRQDILETMSALINDEDRRIIAAIALLGEPAPGEMESFFTSEYSYAELQGILLNLEERLITYRFREDGIFHLALNPKLKTILAPIVDNKGILFPVQLPDSPGDFAPPALNGRTLAALFAFFLKGEPFYKNEGPRDLPSQKPVFKKKILDEGSRIFPGLDLETLAGGLLALGLLDRADDFFKPCEMRIAAFKELDSRSLFEYLAAGIALCPERDLPGSGYTGMGLIKNLAKLIHGLTDSLLSSSGFTEAALVKLVEIQRREETARWGFVGKFPPIRAILRGLILSGLLVQAGAVCRFSAHAEGNATDDGNEKGKGPAIAMDSSFSCILYPEISVADALDLAAFAEAAETAGAASVSVPDAVVRFTLSRESVVRGFDRGLDAAGMWKLLERLSAGRADEALRWNLEDWEKRYREVSLHQGVVLCLGGERSYLAETAPVAAMISRTLAPGVYLLSRDADEAAAALRAAGVDILARPQGAAGGISDPFPPLGGSRIMDLPASAAKAEATAEAGESVAASVTDTAADTAGAEKILQRFRSQLKDMKINRQEQEELEARIARRMIVSGSRLTGAALRYEKLEARSLDYVGKASVAKQAIAARSVLELAWSSPEGPSKILGLPEALEKKGGELVLILRLRNQDEVLRIPLGKISFLRRIKQSIFGE